MSTLSQSIPNLLQGISQQPDNRKRPGQVNDLINGYPDFALGLLKRPGGQFVSKLHKAPVTGKWFPILRDNQEKYVACYADNRFHVWDLIEQKDTAGVVVTRPGAVRTVDMGNQQGKPITCNILGTTPSDQGEIYFGGLYNDEVNDTAEFLTALQSKGNALAKATEGRVQQRNKYFAFQHQYSQGSVTETLHSGMLESASGYYTVKWFTSVLAACDSIPSHVALINSLGSGLTDGRYDNVATSGSATGSGMTFDITITDGALETATIHTPGDGLYEVGDSLTLTGHAGPTLTVYKLDVGTERTDDHPLVASEGFRVYEIILQSPETYTSAQLTSAQDLYDKTINTVVADGALQDYDNAVTDETTAQTDYNTAFDACAIATYTGNTFRIIEDGNGFTDGTFTNQSTTAITGDGAGMVVDLRIESGKIVTAIIGANSGAAYAQDDLLRTTADALRPVVNSTTQPDNAYTGITTTTTKGDGTGLTVDFTVSGGLITGISINNAGTGYVNDDEITIDGHASNGGAPCRFKLSRVRLELARDPYLAGATADDIEVLTLNDATFILNKKKKVQMRNKLSHQTNHDENRAQVVVGVAANSTPYTVILTPEPAGGAPAAANLSSAASSSGIAEALKTNIDTVDTGNIYDVTVVGGSIYITSDDPFTVETRGGQTENAIFTITDNIGDTTRLPLQSKNGYVVKVVNAEDIEIDDMYVEFTTDGGADFGTGQWTETIAPDMKYKFDDLTMPHKLVRQADNSFTYEPVDWNDRLVGDDNTNPVPSFVDSTIDHMFFYRNRLGFLSGQNVILSKAGDLFNFFNTSAQAPTQDDPIDISAAGKRPVFLHYASTTAVGLVMYSSNEQFLLTTDSDILSPTTAKVNSISTYECDPNLESVSIGVSQAFVSKTPLYTRVFELMDVTPDQPPQLLELSNTVPELIPEGMDSMIASPVLSLVSLGQTGTSTLYLYRFLNRTRSERAISSWFKWELTGTLLTQFFDNSTLYAVVKNGSDVYVQSFDLTQSTEEGFLTLPTGETTDVCLDLFTTNPHRTYDKATFKTRVYLPYDTVTDKELNVVVLGGFIGDTSTDAANSVGLVLKPTIAGTAGNRHVDIDGDYRGRDIVIGYRYDMQVDLPKFYRFTTSDGQVSNDDVSSLIIHRIKVKTGLSGPVDYAITITGLEEWTNTVSVTQPNQYQLNNVNMQARSTHVVPIYQRNENLAISVVGNTPFPVSLLGLDWEGKLNQRFYRRG